MLHLQMQPAECPLDRAAVIVLDELRIDPGRLEFIFLPGLLEESAGIAEYLRLDQHHARDGSPGKFHSVERLNLASARERCAAGTRRNRSSPEAWPASPIDPR